MKRFKNVNLYEFKDKDKVMRDEISYMLNRTQSMFAWNGLPETIPKRVIELFLQVNGFVCIAKHENDLYCFTGGLGGELDYNYEPTLCVVSNPALKFSKDFRINTDCVIIRNDSLMTGLRPLFGKYSTLITENLITMKMLDIKVRAQSIISATDDNTLKSARNYLEKLAAGDDEVIADSEFFESLKTSDYAKSTGTSMMSDLIEYHQYLRASWFNDLGLNANYNMKREAINSNESQLNDDMLLPLVDDMLYERQEGVKRVNQLFGVNWNVDFSSAWKREQESQNESDDSTRVENNDDKGGESNVSTTSVE